MPYRILSLDGGGMRGVLSAKILEIFEDLIKQPLHEYFDLIAGTSTGSILAAGIAKKKNSKQLVDLYVDNGNRIFPYTGLWGYLNLKRRWKLIRNSGFSAPKFSHKGIKRVLQEQFGNTTLSQINNDSLPKLIITSYDTNSRSPLIFKSWNNGRFPDIFLWETCVCSASAPTFFPAYRIVDSNKITYSAIDGGVGANNPAACAIAEAIRLGQKVEDITVLSIGTGDLAKGFPYNQVRHWGVLQWAGHLVDLLMDAPLDIHEYIARQLICSGHKSSNRYLRLQPKLTSMYLDQDIELKETLRRKLQQMNFKGKDITIPQAIDDASPESLQILICLAQAYFQNGTIEDQDMEGNPIIETVKDKLLQFIETNR